jgi:hypothetical protein
MKLDKLIVLAGFLPALVLAQNAPNMIGTWTATSNSAVIGSSAHHIVPNKGDKEIHFNKVPLSLVIDRQEGLNFSGSLSSPKHKEVIIGAIMPDFQGGVMTDEDGTHAFKIIDSTTIQNCYVQISKPRVASCWTAKKQR